jgi:hypothetical protein
MTINEMFDELENMVRDTYIVTLKYKYDFEKNYIIENHILEYESIPDSYVWLDDWYEGQTDIEVLGYMLLGDVDTTKLLTCEDCISKDLPSVTPSYNSIKTELKPYDTPRTNLAETSQDCISRKAVNKLKKYRFSYDTNTTIPKAGIFVKIADIAELPSVTPKFTDEEIQKIQELEQAQLEKAYELGKAESFEEWLSSFNTESAPQCFNAVQQLKEKLNGQMD